MSKAQQAVVTAHYGIARGMARSAFKRHVERWGNHAGSMGDNRGILLYDDFLSAACEGLCQAVRAQALCLLASLVACDRLDIEDLGRRLLAWYQEGYLAVDGRVFDVGVQTAYAIRRLGRGFHATHAAAAADEKANGNGSLMRVLPLALWHQGDDAELVNDAHRQSLVTHGHLRAQVCCALYCLWARRTLEQAADPWAAAVASIRAVYGRAANGTAMLGELEFHVRPDDPSAGQGGGYVVDCLRSARWAVARGNYPRAIKAAISLGRDTDTTACVAGGIAGVRDGVLGIPKRWRQGIRGCELADPLVAALVARWSSK